MELVEIGSARLYRGDCLEAMRKMPNKAFDLAIVDPPYGIDAAQVFSGEQRRSGKGAALKSAFAKKDWDKKIPPPEYFSELRRVSKHQIVWGANYMSHLLPPSMGWIVWDKDNGTTKFSDCELAFSSFDVALRKYTYMWNGMLQGNMRDKEFRIHPTQKPVQLYKWLLQNYAKEGDKILDTHLGSGSHAIAALDMGFEITAYEIDTDYFTAAVERIQRSQDQLKLAL